MSIADLVGVLGFVVALSTFILTRWERRRKIEYRIYTDRDQRFLDVVDDRENNPILLVEIINTGKQYLVLDRDSFVFYSNRASIPWYEVDFFGREDVPSPLCPGEKAEVGILLKAFCNCYGSETQGPVPVGFEVSDVDGNTYRTSDKFVLLPQVGEIEARP
ncbi:MAG: hypothetical protein GY838_05460 [bacterium]|nr:hypothetical protein [bacterium]